MESNDRSKISWLKATTIVALSSSIIASTTYGLIKQEEINSLEKDLLEQKKINELNEDNLANMEYSLVKKSEQMLKVESENKQLESDYKVLESEYKENLKELNNVQGKLREKKTARLTNFPKVSEKENYSSWKRLKVESTAYTKFENGDALGGRQWGNITASGVPVQYGVIAVDTNVIPMGTEVYIPLLDKVFVALDTGSAINGNIIDVYFDDLKTCIQWGRKKIEVYVNM